MEQIKRFVKDEEGIEFVEWAIMAGVFALGMVAAISTGFLPAMEGVYNTIAGSLVPSTPTP